MCLFYNAKDPQLNEKFQNLKPTPGYCVFVDIAESVALKDQGMEVWCATIHNTFLKSKYWLDSFLPIKSIGDCIMFFIPENSLPEGFDTLSLFHSLHTIIRDGAYPKQPVRLSATFCENAYEITFIEGVKDVYGKEIDLAARLLDKANPQELVMNESFYFKAKDVYTRLWDQNDYKEFGDVLGPWPEIFKGFNEPVKIYKWCGPPFKPRY
jgi:hypothetical protein